MFRRLGRPKLCEPKVHSFNLRKKHIKVSARHQKETIQGNGPLANCPSMSTHVGLHCVKHSLDVIVSFQTFNQAFHFFRLVW